MKKNSNIDDGSRPFDEADPYDEEQEKLFEKLAQERREQEADHWTKEMPDRTSFYNKEGEEVIKIEMPDFIFQPVNGKTPKGYHKVKLDFGGATPRVKLVKKIGY